MRVHFNPYTQEVYPYSETYEHIYPWNVAEIPDTTNPYEYIVENYQLVYNPEQAKTFWNNKYKATARTLIETQVGDDKDLVADLSKRVDWLERALIRLMAHTLNVIPMSEEYQIKYGAFCTTLINMVESGLYTPRADLYDDEEALFEELVSRQNTIGQIVKTEYLNKIIT